MTPDELREAVARAICKANGEDPNHKMDAAGRVWWTMYERDADAAISTVLAALEEPTEGMLMAADDHWPTRAAPVLWSAMFSARKEELTNGH